MILEGILPIYFLCLVLISMLVGAMAIIISEIILDVIRIILWIVIIICIIISPWMWFAIFIFILIVLLEPDYISTDNGISVIDECRTVIDEYETIIDEYEITIAENLLNHQADDNAQQVINVSIQDSIVQRSDMCPTFTSK